MNSGARRREAACALRGPSGALRLPSTALLLLLSLTLSGCIARPRPSPGTPSPAAPWPRFADGFEAFATARAGDDMHVLALSGGGQNGAFGAGVLRGWRDAGRPKFDVVTGVSTGALLATHAFLGTPADDELLHRAYTEARKSDTFCQRNPLTIPLGASVYDSRPLERMIAVIVPNATIDRVAVASEGGRRLLAVGTTNLDAGKFVVWDMGALARARSYDRYRAVLLASSSPPLVAEPVFLDGSMHADGSVVSNVFVPDPEVDLSHGKLDAFRALGKSRSPEHGTRFTIHVIVNGLLGTAPSCVENMAVSIGKRTVSLVLNAATIGALWQVYGIAKRGGHTVRIVAIPESLRASAEDSLAFEPAAMQALYAGGLAAGRDPSQWRDEPPTVEGR